MKTDLNIAIVGSSGYIASFLLEKFENDPNVDKILKIGQDGVVDEYINLQKSEEFNYSSLDDIDFVIFTAAISGPDKCANDFDFCWGINVIGTEYFIREAVKKNCKVLFFSSDAVFGDIPGMIYNEESPTQPLTPYGCMKKHVEDEFKGNPLFKAIRLSYVASQKDRFISYCLKCIETKDTANIFHPFYRNVIIVSDVVEVVMWLTKHWNEYDSQVLCVAGMELVSRIRMADELNRIYNNRLHYTISSPGNEFYRNRPWITQMQSLYLHKFEIIENNTFTEKLQKQLKGIEA